MSLIDKHITLDYPLDAQTAFQRALEAAKNVKGLSFAGALPESRTLYLEGELSWWSWGEKVTIVCTALDQRTTRIFVTSAPKVGTTLIDWGKGSRNIKAVKEALDAAMQRPATTQTTPPPPPPPSSANRR